MLLAESMYHRNIVKDILQRSHAGLLTFANGFLASVLTLLLINGLKEFVLQKVM